ncbi:glycine receptor subunit alpha-1 [Lingula anatina]|uniref:Glycine receptor subunit alpha-1 n=1 Tax=Lingula anatina TaxID=7574 RepID=A0A1S3J3L9_LINAN|nr:glycine receptor subunit alpha-1 [Lingula anatina]|eukprot:XP_013404995.1 glycine receptor subunit alpha-1 [Lingula anatina]
MKSFVGLQVVLLVIFLTGCKCKEIEKVDYTDAKSSLLAQMDPLIYDPEVRPHLISGTPEVVAVGIEIDTFSEISVAKMDFTAEIYLRQYWMDPRLADNGSFGLPISLTASETVSSIWKPDLYFLNEKSAKLHSVPSPNILLRIWPTGQILYSQRLSLTIGCQFDFFNFPMDVQICKLEMQSYAYSTDDLHFRWHEPPIDFRKSDLNFPEFELIDIEVDKSIEEHQATGNYSRLIVAVRIKRDSRPYIINIYVPSTVVVILSFMSMWIDPRAVPARVTIGIITVLTTMTQSVNIQQELPKVSYVKAVDVWLAACLVFVVGAMLQYALVNVLLQREADRNKKEPHHAVNRVNPEALSMTDTPAPLVSYWSPGKVDMFGRVVFFVGFAVFNLFYWLFYVLL